jgi:NAD(P)-dependent dehydrogenase (short-subunit alcohol dehydrogenase family)
MSPRRTIVFTGASSGIGASAARMLAAHGADVAVVGRNPERTRTVAERIGGSAFVADFGRLDDVRALADELLARYERLDVLVNNAGGLVSRRETTVDGHDLTFQANYLAPYLLTRLLLPRLEASGTAERPSRVISTASSSNQWGRIRLDGLEGASRPWRGGWGAYGTSKLAVILFIRELAHRTAGLGLDAYAVHPGAVVTGFGGDSTLIRFGTTVTAGRWGLTPDRGAAPLVSLVLRESIDAPSGSYFTRFSPSTAVARQARDERLQIELWRRTAELVGLGADLP